MLSEVVHKGAKAKAHLFGEATLRTFYKAKALSGDARTASSGEAYTCNAYDNLN